MRNTFDGVGGRVTRTAKSLAFGLVICIAVIVSGCAGASPVTPGFPARTSQGWRSTGLPLSVSASGAANAMIPRLYVLGTLDSLRQVYVPAPGTSRLTWDSLRSTGEILVLTRDPDTYQSDLFSIRPDPIKGEWQYELGPYQSIKAEEFFTAIRATSDTLRPERFQARFVPTTFGGLDWMVVLTTGDHLYASPVRLPRSSWGSSVDGQILAVGQVFPPDAILHPVVEALPHWP